MCPCKNCICVAVCAHKQYTDLFFGCSLLQEYLINGFSFGEPIRKNGKLAIVYKTLNPSSWGLICDEYERVMVENRTGYSNCTFIY